MCPKGAAGAWWLAATIALSGGPLAAEEPLSRPEAGAMPADDWSETRRPPPASVAGSSDQRINAEGIRASLDEQLVAGVARPRIDLNIEFEFASAELTDDGRRDLTAAGEALTRYYAETRFELAGHTDRAGPADYNLGLSIARAEAARRYLIDNFDISPERLDATGFGETQPLPESPPEKNRRVVLELVR